MSNISSAHIYHFALYGRRASGKTCLLAALAMPRLAHRKGYTCTWVRDIPGMIKPEGDPEEWDREDTSVSFYRGSEWLKKAINKLQTNDVPDGNPIDDPVRFRYDFTSPDHATYTVEITDYSGEMIDPELAADELAQRIQKHMMQMDGIMVLAEAPYPGHDTEHLPIEFQRLQEAFSILKDKMRKTAEIDTCIALLVNKWDRRSPLEYCAPENEDAELHEFLNEDPEPPHKQLHYILKQSVAENDYRCFPVSAFGEHRLVIEDGKEKEVPKHINPLKSFGLEDPFIWAASRSDEVVMKRLKKRAAYLNYWKIWQTPFSHIRKVQQSVNKIIIRFPKESNEYKELISIKKRTTHIMFVHCFLYIFVMILAVTTSKVLFDLHVAKKADEAYNVLQTRHGEPGELELANEFIQRFGSNVPHSDEVNAILSRYNSLESEKQAQEQARIKVDSDVRLLKHIMSMIKQKATTGDITDFDIDGYVQQLSLISSMENKEVRDLYSEVDNMITDVRIKVASATFDKWFRANLEGGKLYDAMQALAKNSNLEQKDIETFVNLFVQQCNIFENKEQYSSNGYKNIREEIKRVLLNKDIVSILSGEPVTAVERSVNALLEKEDKCIYEKIRKYSEVTNECLHSAEAYIETAPLKTMDDEAKQVIKYYHDMEKELDVVVELSSIKWSKNGVKSVGWCGSEVLVKFDGEKLIEIKKVSSTPGTIVKEKWCSQKKRYYLDRQGLLEVKIINDGWIKNKDNGKGYSGQWLIRDFIDGDLPVPVGEGKEPHKLNFNLIGIPKKLNPGLLPPWKKE